MTYTPEEIEQINQELINKLLPLDLTILYQEILPEIEEFAEDPKNDS